MFYMYGAVCRHTAPCWCGGSRSKIVSPLRLHSKATAFWINPLVTLLLLAYREKKEELGHRSANSIFYFIISPQSKVCYADFIHKTSN